MNREEFEIRFYDLSSPTTINLLNFILSNPEYKYKIKEIKSEGNCFVVKFEENEEN